jgi:hypothetical protein
MPPLPFTREVFFQVVAQYNAAIWPTQMIAYGLGLLTILLILRPLKGSDKVISTLLAGAWLWIGVVYHMGYFATINLAAWLFGVLFIVQGLLLLWAGTLRGQLVFRFIPDRYGWIGLGLLLYAMAGYSLLGWLTGHGWPQVLLFGVAPCPTALSTLGILLLTVQRVPVLLLVIPILWSLIGGMAVWLLNIPEDLGLLVGGVLAAWLIIWKNRRLALAT